MILSDNEQVQQEDTHKAARPRISAHKANSAGRARLREREKSLPDLSQAMPEPAPKEREPAQPTLERNGTTADLAAGGREKATTELVLPSLEREKTTTELVMPAPEREKATTELVLPTPERNQDPFDPEREKQLDFGTLQLEEIEFGMENPNTDFGAGHGPGTQEQPRVLTCGTIKAAYASDIGRVRHNNEDSAVAFVGMVERIDTPFGFFAVADGMGGHENGEVASNLAVRKMMDEVMREFYLPSKEGRELGVAGETPAEIMTALIANTNQAILDESKGNYRNAMGTTLSCIVLFGQVGIIGHVGDSRIYVIERESGEMRHITRDHSMVQRLVEAGQITPEQAIDHPQRSLLYMSLGQRGGLYPETQILPLGDLSDIMICSDGLWDMIDDPTIQQLIMTNPDPANACQALIAAANEAGGNDNVSVILVKL